MKLYILLLAIIIVTAGCNSKSAFQYSESIVKKEKSLEPQIIETESKAETFMVNAKYDSLAAVAQKMENAIDERITEIRSSPAPEVKEADNFKNACIRYFEYLKSVYTSYRAYAQAGSEQDRETAKTKMIDIVNKKQTAIGDMQSAQKKFADANGFKLEGK